MLVAGIGGLCVFTFILEALRQWQRACCGWNIQRPMGWRRHGRPFGTGERQGKRRHRERSAAGAQSNDPVKLARCDARRDPIAGNWIVRHAPMQWSGVVRFRFAPLTITAVLWCPTSDGPFVQAPAHWALDVPRLGPRSFASRVTPRFKCAMVQSISGSQTMEHASNTFQTFEDFEVYRAVL